MAFSYGFFDSVGGDRKYTALEMSSIFDGVITDGVLPNYLNCFKVIPGRDLSLIVQSGRAWFDHTWSYNSSNLLLYVNDADRVLTRYDAVVLEVNKARDVRANTIKLITGMPSTSPTRPALMNTKEVKQYALAYIQVDPKATTITTAAIQNMVGTPNTPYATSNLKATDISAVFQQWQGEFEEWYETVKHITSGENIAALQAELAKKLPRSEKATTSTPVTDNTKYLTPATGLALVDSQVNPIGTIISTESGSYPSGNWVRCNNSNYLQTASYPVLFTEMGHAYGMRSTMSKAQQYRFYYGKTGDVWEDGSAKYDLLMEPANASIVTSLSLQALSEEAAPANLDLPNSWGSDTYSSEELSKGARVSARKVTGYPAFENYVAAVKPRSTGSNIKFAATFNGEIYEDSYRKSFDWSGTATPSGITINNPNATEAWFDSKERFWIQDTSFALPSRRNETTPRNMVIAIVDDTNKYSVSVEAKYDDNSAVIHVTVYSGGASSLTPDSNRSYDINVPAEYGGCWVFNNQIYYVTNGQIYIVTFGSASPMLYTGSAAQQTIIKYFCRCIYAKQFIHKSGNETDEILGQVYRVTLNSGYSLDNKIYVQMCETRERIYDYLYVDIVMLKNEYTGEIERHRKRISLKPFCEAVLGSSGSNSVTANHIKPVIKRNSDGSVTIAIMCLVTIYPNVYSSSWDSSSYSFRHAIYTASVTGDAIRDDVNDILYTSNPYMAPKISEPGSSTNPAMEFANWNYSSGYLNGDICETLSDYATVMYYSYQYYYRQSVEKWLQLTALMLDTRTFAMPWLNNVTNTSVFHIRIS